MIAYYNECDPKAAAWLRELIAQGLIAPGVVDDRSIEDVRPSDLNGFTQCHFFAGIGVWSYALRRAGWTDDRRVWTGSCPCQPFSQAGQGAGFDDERHLWPAWHHLIAACQPPVVFGEQVASKDGLAWLDLVQPDLEATGYTFGAADLCAAGVGAPHIRQRLFFVALAEHGGRAARDAQRAGTGAAMPSGGAGGLADDHGQGLRFVGAPRLHADGQPGHDVAGRGAHGALGHADDDRARQHGGTDAGREGRDGVGAQASGDAAAAPRATGGVGDAERAGREGRVDEDLRGEGRRDERGLLVEPGGVPLRIAADDGRGTHWSRADWIFCRDGRYRPVEPGAFPLAHGAPARMGRLRGYGNAIVAEVAETFIRATIEAAGL